MERKELVNCPFCGGENGTIGKQHRVMGHGDSGNETFLKCPDCGAIVTFEGYYNTFDPAKYNVRTTCRNCATLQEQRDIEIASKQYLEKAILQIPDLGDNESYQVAVKRIVEERDQNGEHWDRQAKLNLKQMAENEDLQKERDDWETRFTNINTQHDALLNQVEGLQLAAESATEERDRVNERLQESQELCMEGAEQLEVAAAKIDGYATEFEKGALEIRKAQEVNGILHFELRTALAEKGKLENDWEEPMAERLERADKWIQTRLEEAVKMRKAYGVRTDLDPDDIGGYLLPGPDGAEWKALLESVKEEGHVVRNPGLIAGPVESVEGTEEVGPGTIPGLGPDDEVILADQGEPVIGSLKGLKIEVEGTDKPEEYVMKGVKFESGIWPVGITKLVQALRKSFAVNPDDSSYDKHLAAALAEFDGKDEEDEKSWKPGKIASAEFIADEKGDCYPHMRCPDCNGRGGHDRQSMGVNEESWNECRRCNGTGILVKAEEE